MIMASTKPFIIFVGFIIHLTEQDHGEAMCSLKED